MPAGRAHDPLFTWISPPASGTSRWITSGLSAAPLEYATNAASTASMQADIGSAARTSPSRRILRLDVIVREPRVPDAIGSTRPGLAAPAARASVIPMTGIDAFEMERYQSLYWHLV